MLEGLRIANALCWRLSLSSYTLSLNGVWFFLIFLVLPFLFFLTVVLLSLDLCPHGTSPMYSVWAIFIINDILMLFIKKKKHNLCTDNSMIRANSKMKKTCKQSVHLLLSIPIKLTHALKSSPLMTMTWLPPINAMILLASVQSTISSVLLGQAANKNNTTYCKKWPYLD